MMTFNEIPRETVKAWNREIAKKAARREFISKAKSHAAYAGAICAAIAGICLLVKLAWIADAICPGIWR